MKWNEFKEYVRNSFKSFRSEGKLFDVTLATDDGHQIQAHKLILSVGSDFFMELFSKSEHFSTLVYLRGVKKHELENLIQFLYEGEIVVAQEALNGLLVIAKELKVKDLQNVDFNEESKPKVDDHEIKVDKRQETLSEVSDVLDEQLCGLKLYS